LDESDQAMEISREHKKSNLAFFQIEMNDSYNPLLSISFCLL